jgi:hypothetical protein
MLFFARIFHIFGDWVNEKFILESLVKGEFIEFFKLFFIPPNYLFSLFGGIVGFFLVFLIKTRWARESRPKYLESIVFAFLYSCILWYAWAFLGGQVFGIPFDSPFSITYTHSNSIVKDSVPLFPLALFYILWIMGIIFGLQKFWKIHTLPDGFLWLIGIGCFSLLVFFGEFLSGDRQDIFYDLVMRMTRWFFWLSLNQIWALIGVTLSILWILRTAEHEIKK